MYKRQVKRRGNRRYYQHQDVVTVRRIRDLLYRQGFTIGGARQRLRELPSEKKKTPSTPLGQLREIRAELNSILKLLDAT